MKKINLKDVVQGLKTTKNKSYNTDLFSADAENITETFNKSNYTYLELLSTDHDPKTGLIRETILAIGEQGDSYLISTNPSLFNGEITISIFSKWLTLQGFNYFSKNSELFFDGEIQMEAVNYYDNYLQEQGYDISYQDILELAEYNSEYNIKILSFSDEENNYYITINSKNQLSKITKKPSITPPKTANVIKSILD
jgi:hypothetical protein